MNGKQCDLPARMQGLALATSDAGRAEDASDCWKAAQQRTSDPLALSQLKRNLGLLLTDVKRDDQAENELRQAVELAGGGGRAGRGEQDGGEMLGRRSRWAIFHRHRGRMSEMRSVGTFRVGFRRVR